MILPFSPKKSPGWAIILSSLPALILILLIVGYKQYRSAPVIPKTHTPVITLDEAKIQELDQVAFQIRSIALDEKTLSETRRTLLQQALVLWRFEIFLINVANAVQPSSAWEQEKKRVEDVIQSVQAVSDHKKIK